MRYLCRCVFCIVYFLRMCTPCEIVWIFHSVASLVRFRLLFRWERLYRWVEMLLWQAWGKVNPGSKVVYLYTLTNPSGAAVRVMPWGATVVGIHVPDRYAQFLYLISVIFSHTISGCECCYSVVCSSEWRVLRYYVMHAHCVGFSLLSHPCMNSILILVEVDPQVEKLTWFPNSQQKTVQVI